MASFISPGDLKTILLSKRANLYYLEHCRVLCNGGRVEYVTDKGKQSLYWNIPIANTTTVLLGTGTSITQAAMREFARAGVMTGFCGGGGTPLFAASEHSIDIEWITPQSEYRPTEYLQNWCRFWFDDGLRLEAAKAFQLARLQALQRFWTKTSLWDQTPVAPNAQSVEALVQSCKVAVIAASDQTALLTEEARLSKQLFRLASGAVRYGEFKRGKRGESNDSANQFLDHGNYLAYGLAASATWVLGIPHGFAVLHGKTRRGGLVFDVADLVKDAHVLPQAFISAARGDSEQEFRHACIASFSRHDALDFMIDTLKSVALEFGRKAQVHSAGKAGNELESL
jgi:CRISPR-associated protein Cas1